MQVTIFTTATQSAAAKSTTAVSTATLAAAISTATKSAPPIASAAVDAAVFRRLHRLPRRRLHHLYRRRRHHRRRRHRRRRHRLRQHRRRRRRRCRRVAKNPPPPSVSGARHASEWEASGYLESSPGNHVLHVSNILRRGRGEGGAKPAGLGAKPA